MYPCRCSERSTDPFEVIKLGSPVVQCAPLRERALIELLVNLKGVPLTLQRRVADGAWELGDDDVRELDIA